MESEDQIVELTQFAVMIEDPWFAQVAGSPMRNVAIVLGCGLGFAIAGAALLRR
jgi:hypothetical protein